MSQELTHYQEKMLAEANAYAASVPQATGNFISTRGGIFKVGDLEMRDLAVVVLDLVLENTYYEGKWDANNPQPPKCYAFGREPKELAPHPAMASDLSWFKPQHVECKGCPRNEWGSADQGKGKACQNRARLALIPAGYYAPRPGSRDVDLHLIDDPQHYASADMYLMRLPVTSVKGFGEYVKLLAQQHRLAPYGAVTHMFTEADPKSQYKVKFELADKIKPDLLPTIMERAARARSEIITTYSAPDAPF